MTQQLAEKGAKIDAIYYCPHTSTEKLQLPQARTGMLDGAALEHTLDLQRSFVVGDRYGDMELARNARARSVLVRTGYGEGELALATRRSGLAARLRRGRSHQRGRIRGNEDVRARKSQAVNVRSDSRPPRARGRGADCRKSLVGAFRTASGRGDFRFTFAVACKH